MGGVVFPLKVIYLTLHASNNLITCAIMGLSATVCVFQVICFFCGTLYPGHDSCLYWLLKESTFVSFLHLLYVFISNNITGSSQHV